MNMNLKKYLEEILPTVKDLLSFRGYETESELLKLGNMDYIENYDDFGNDYDEVVINVQTDKYVSLIAHYKTIEELESIIHNAFVEATRSKRVPNKVTISPNSNVQATLFESGEYQGWRNGYFRMFISHITTKKDKASSLKTALEEYGITSFVAHEDIYPTKEWQKEIEKALNSMHCMCAMIYEGFHESNWCDQEVGVALGRNITVLPLIIDKDPYGFLGQYQGIKIKGKYPDKLAKEIFYTLCDNSNTRSQYLTCLTNIFLSSTNIEDGKKWLSLIEAIPNTDEDFWRNIHSHAYDNEVLTNSSILSRLNVQFENRNIPTLSTNVTTINSTDGLPF